MIANVYCSIYYFSTSPLAFYTWGFKLFIYDSLKLKLPFVSVVNQRSLTVNYPEFCFEDTDSTNRFTVQISFTLVLALLFYHLCSSSKLVSVDIVQLSLTMLHTDTWKISNLQIWCTCSNTVVHRQKNKIMHIGTFFFVLKFWEVSEEGAEPEPNPRIIKTQVSIKCSWVWREHLQEYTYSSNTSSTLQDVIVIGGWIYQPLKLTHKLPRTCTSQVFKQVT